MELFGPGSGLAREIASQLTANPFVVVDVGCSGGIDPNWRAFEPNLKAIGIDPNVNECERLAAEEKNSAVKYIPGFLAGDPNGDFAKARAGKPYFHRSPWERLSIFRTLELQKQNDHLKSVEQMTQENLWSRMELADPNLPLFLPDVFDREGIEEIDFIKIDVDGPDFELLDSIRDELLRRKVLGIVLEVNWVGSDDPTDHTFHNTDRFLRTHGFDLFDCTVRRYSAAALPQRYLYSYAAQSVRGRALQGDAVYFRDLGDPAAQRPFALTREKALKLAALFDLFNLPDQAAEVLLTFRETIGDVSAMLDQLARATDGKSGWGYEAYMASFRTDSVEFYNAAASSEEIRNRDYLGSMGVTEAGRRVGDIVQADPTADQFVIFGPYLRMPAGHYRTEFALRFADPLGESDSRTIALEVVTRDHFLARREILARNVELGPIVFVLEFKVDEHAIGKDGTAMEFRIRSQAGLKFLVEAVRLY